MNQTTLGDLISLEGIGVHSGAPVKITLHPAEAHTGIIFRRTGLPGGVERDIPARREAVGATELCTVIGEPSGASVSTIEHLMAALAGMGVDNVIAEIDGPEVPIMDGSSCLFVDAIDQAGVEQQRAPRKVIVVLKPVRIEHGRSWAELTPRARGFDVDVEIDFPTQLIGRQRRTVDVTPANFRKDIARARTFGFMKDVEYLWKKNLALGASLENTVALGDDRIINPEGLRYPDEFVRHKILDAIGDLALAGARLQASYKAYIPGHKINAMMLEALFADRSAYKIVEAPLVRRELGRGEGVMAAAAYAADKN
ncbi:MAG: UDP-3-O-acyl-N-acetylglucosamine deacetylase [Methylocystis sp.]|nr:UDP-3-O-acyl-N-acetylglucosamine deacetylase [Methylocystis sp.]MCA3583373.1 UDP-3-O-acyl-N-acetylglucosamine deacetylase [Methylocystis sp.]MCA3589753.1 UDP-3-O-acyl-N-acetylglucosamine deacetylase [Methylocystis sp.]MCA3591892.1 UDP-3-O-acyl-N-acetylglucosamine deacetylase [Methylocystis sp.]